MLLLHLILFGALATLTRAAYYPECGGSDYGSFIASPRSCSMYIYCQGENSMEGSCMDGLHFSADEVTCVLPEEANCQIERPVPTDEPYFTRTQPSVVDPSTVAPINPTTIIRDPSTLSPINATTIIREPSTVDLINATTIVRNSCPVEDKVNEVVLLASNNSCSLHYLCHYGQAIEMRCSQGLHFNPRTGMCDFPDKVGCSLDRVAEQCLPDVIDYFPHSGNCHFFYSCNRGLVTLHQCPYSFGWDVERRACVLMSQAICFQSAITVPTPPSNHIRYL